MRHRFRIELRAVTLAAVFSAVAMAQQKAPAGKNTKAESQPAGDRAAIARGRIVYRKRCEACHASASDAQRFGSSMKGIYKRGKFPDGSNVTDASVEKWIMDGGEGMPSFRAILKPSQIQDLIAYMKAL